MMQSRQRNGPLRLTSDLARAAAMDAANRQMRVNGRAAWNIADYNLACAELERLWPSRVLDCRPNPFE